MKEEPRYARKTARRPFLIAIICIALVVAAALGWYFSSYTWVNGQCYSRKETHVDLSGSTISSAEELKGFRALQELNLRGTGLTAAQYDQVAEWYPQCNILWDVPFQGNLIQSTVKSLTISSLSDSDVELLDYFPELETVDAAECSDYAQLSALRNRRPDLKLTYSVRIGQEEWPQDTKAMALSDPDGAELLDRLAYLPKLETVALSGDLPAPEVLQELCRTYPNVNIGWTLELGDCSLTKETTVFELSNWSLESAGDLETIIAYGPNLQTLAVLGSSLSNETLSAVQTAHPELDLVWDITLGDKTFRTDVEKLDLSNVTLNHVSDLEDLFPYLPNLTWVDVSFCGLPDEDLDAFNRRHADIRVVWSVAIGDFAYVRTDETIFMPTKYQYWVNNDFTGNLKYCTDMICIDIGHNPVTHVEFVRYMPHLKFLIIADTLVTSLEPLRGLKELIYLEAFMTNVSDYSPLLDCPSLLDVNVAQTYGDLDVFKQMTQLERLWVYPYGGYATIKPIIESLSEALPNTQVVRAGGTAGSWRKHERYYEMRDLLGMHYMK